jgi:hypothetical protein
LVDVDKLVPNPKNYNKHSDQQIEMLANIIKYQGQRLPIVVSKRSGFIVAGHGRLMAIKKLGWAQAACDYQDFASEVEEHAHMIADNRIAELSEPDHGLLDDLVIGLGEGFDLLLAGLVVEDIVVDEPEPSAPSVDGPKCEACGRTLGQKKDI